MLLLLVVGRSVAPAQAQLGSPPLSIGQLLGLPHQPAPSQLPVQQASFLPGPTKQWSPSGKTSRHPAPSVGTATLYQQ